MASRRPVEVWRSYDAPAINAILNHPEVLPSIVLPEMRVIDATELLADASNVLLMAEGGCMFFISLGEGLFELHTNFLPGHRGAYVLAASRAAYQWMFTNTECMAILTRVPATNRPAALFARIAGFTQEFERKSVWPTPAGLVDMGFFALRYDDWVRKTPSLSEMGRDFHAILDAEMRRHGRTEPNHPDDEAHDRHVGACWAMCRGGQPEKAVILYNRWARFAGYGQIGFISRDPVLLDIGTCLICVSGNSFRVIKPH